MAEPGTQPCPVCARQVKVAYSTHAVRAHKRPESLKPTSRVALESKERRRSEAVQLAPAAVTEARIATHYLNHVQERLSNGETLDASEMGVIAALLQLSATLSNMLNRGALVIQSRLKTR